MKLILPFPKRSRESALGEVPAEVRFVLGDRHYNTPTLGEFCEQADRLLVATQYDSYPHTDDGSMSGASFISSARRLGENCNEHFKGIFEAQGQVPDLWLVSNESVLREAQCLSSNLLSSLGVSMTLSCVWDRRAFLKGA